MIIEHDNLSHWNYFLALEEDVLNIARYIELTKENFSTYSIELARILFASSSEVDVISKMICSLVAQNKSAENINDYKEILRPRFPFIETIQIFIPRYGLTLTPWANWKENKNPI